MTPSLPMGDPRRQTSSSPLLSTNGTATVACALRLYIREAFRLSWIGTWIRAKLERRSNR
jgi:hypothetical protein